jgi:hypothetical protein
LPFPIIFTFSDRPIPRIYTPFPSSEDEYGIFFPRLDTHVTVLKMDTQPVAEDRFPYVGWIQAEFLLGWILQS